jgi:SPP1 family predicted phage head-tail adaptor
LTDYRAIPQVQAGTFHHRVAYQTFTQGTASALGDSAKSWVTLGSCWASVECLSGVKLLRAKEIHEDIDYEVIIRYNPLINETCRFLFGSLYLYPLAVIPDDLNRYMTAHCEERDEDALTS